MKNHKGVVATLLTLGLVLVGTLLTLGISYLTNTNKIASNLRAAEDSCSDPDNSCWIVKCINGKPDYLQYSSSLCQYDMPISSCPDGGASPYGGGGKMAYGRASRDALVEEFTCTGSGNAGSGNEEQGEGTDSTDPATAECPTIDYNCNKIDSTIYKDHVLSIDEDGLYHDGDSCEGKGMKKAKIKTDVCDDYKVTTNECFPSNCQDIDPAWTSIELLAMGDGTARKYYTDLDRECASTSYTGTTIVSICNPEAAPTCDTITCSNIVTDLDPKYADKEIYQWSNASGTYYKDDKCSDNKKISDINKECPQAKPTGILDNVIKPNDTEAQNYFCGTAAGLITHVKFGTESLQNFVQRCQAAASVQNYSSFNVVISDVNLESFIMAEYMHCCTK